MSKRIGILALCNTAFLLLLTFASATVGWLHYLIYFSAFIIPASVALLLTRKEEKEGKGYLYIVKEDVKKVAPLIMPTVALVIIVSALTSLVMYLVLGRTNNVELGDSFVIALIKHALLPAVLEELLFRYIPLRLLLPYSRRATVIISALFFSLVHHDFFTIPYAFIAGIIFMAVDVATESVIPSLIMHFINNALSVGLIVFKENPAFAPTVYAIIGACSIASLIIIFIKRKDYKEMMSRALTGGETIGFSPEMLIFVGVTLSMAVISLL